MLLIVTENQQHLRQPSVSKFRPASRAVDFKTMLEIHKSKMANENSFGAIRKTTRNVDFPKPSASTWTCQRTLKRAAAHHHRVTWIKVCFWLKYKFASLHGNKSIYVNCKNGSWNQKKKPSSVCGNGTLYPLKRCPNPNPDNVIYAFHDKDDEMEIVVACVVCYDHSDVLWKYQFPDFIAISELKFRLTTHHHRRTIIDSMYSNMSVKHLWQKNRED